MQTPLCVTSVDKIHSPLPGTGKGAPSQKEETVCPVLGIFFCLVYIFLFNFFHY